MLFESAVVLAVKHVPGHVYTHVCTHVCTEVCTHVCTNVYLSMLMACQQMTPKFDSNIFPALTIGFFCVAKRNRRRLFFGNSELRDWPLDAAERDGLLR